MPIHSSILAWRIPWTEEPGRLQSMGLQRVGHDWVTNTTPIIINFIGGSVTRLVMQETIILYNRQNNSNITSSYIINKVISKYLMEEFPVGVAQYLPGLSN